MSRDSIAKGSDVGAVQVSDNLQALTACSGGAFAKYRNKSFCYTVNHKLSTLANSLFQLRHPKSFAGPFGFFVFGGSSPLIWIDIRECTLNVVLVSTA